ncbi:iron chelate uptake ABC transporter family permease subunit [Microbacterium sp. SD291]|uniref:FecCD family ABC transporter permease n=1 Tax=Microbacterium sp. SD291 TaxID=2782007 RepID=UPI001A9754CE|nr:iron chelate uptake ABC transporter family permease subunit [Microbacterium sp. SD291]MBO0979515.1 iron chelate uptake ABC transporter family permease subunit [Microbacterium sp. SD291]
MSAGAAEAGAPRILTVRTRHGLWRLGVRALVVRTIMVVVLLALGAVALTSGTYQLDLSQVIAAISGGGEDNVRKLVVDWRLPRVLFAVLAGVALGVSGAIFQSLTRNPLGSPDVIGFDAGSYTGALVVMLLLGSSSYLLIATGAAAGGILTAMLVYLLAYRGGIQGFRFIIVGIGVSAFLVGVNSYVLISTGAQEARAAVSWGFGSFSALGYEQLIPFAVILAVVVPLVASARRGFAQLELGDDAARALGVRIESTRLSMTVLGVALTALVTAAAGPIAFVALVAPQVARRLVRSPGSDMSSAGLLGAVLLLGADLIGQRMNITVGLVTVVLGGGYFAWLLIREGFRR